MSNIDSSTVALYFNPTAVHNVLRHEDPAQALGFESPIVPAIKNTIRGILHVKPDARFHLAVRKDNAILVSNDGLWWDVAYEHTT